MSQIPQCALASRALHCISPVYEHHLRLLSRRINRPDFGEKTSVTRSPHSKKISNKKRLVRGGRALNQGQKQANVAVDTLASHVRAPFSSQFSSHDSVIPDGALVTILVIVFSIVQARRREKRLLSTRGSGSLWASDDSTWTFECAAPSREPNEATKEQRQEHRGRGEKATFMVGGFIARRGGVTVGFTLA